MQKCKRRNYVDCGLWSYVPTGLKLRKARSPPPSVYLPSIFFPLLYFYNITCSEVPSTSVLVNIGSNIGKLFDMYNVTTDTFYHI